MQGELLGGQDGAFGPLGAARFMATKCRHELARHGSGLRPAAGLRRRGMARSSFYAIPASTREQRMQSVGIEARDLAAPLVATKPTWRHRPGRDEGTARSSASGVATSGLPASGSA